MKIPNGTVVRVHSTGGYIDDRICEVVGISNYFGDEMFGNIYILQPLDGITVCDYDCFTMSEACLSIGYIKDNKFYEKK